VFRAVAVVCAIAAVIYGTVPAAPAPAQTVPSGGPFSLNVSQNKDLVVSETIPHVSPADLRDFYNIYWPRSLGLPAGAPISDEWRTIWQKYWQKYSNNQSQGVDFPEPPSLNGTSLSIRAASPNGSNVTVTVPSTNFTSIPTAEWPQYKRNILGTLGGFFAAFTAFYLTQQAIFKMKISYFMTTGEGGPRLRALGEVVCGAASSLAWGLVADVILQVLSGKPWSPDVWEAISGQIGSSATLSPLVIYAIPALIFILKWLIIGISKGVSWFSKNILLGILVYIGTYVAAGYVKFRNAVRRLFGRGEQQVGHYIQYPMPDLEMGNMRVNVDGDIQNPQDPAASVRPAAGAAHLHVAGAAQPQVNCMDAYGASDFASAGQIVTINNCNANPVNPSQAWGIWSNGMITDFGLCLDTTSFTSRLVGLEPCDGSSSQKWSQVGSTVVNKFTQYCLDDPNGNTSPGIQLDISPCNGSQAQKWQLPAAKPCDIYGSSGTSCGAAYSMTRAMYAAYNGPLYQVKRASDGTTDNIGLLSPGGDVNAAGQDSFCAGTTCTITEIYDQSLHGNNLTVEGPGGNGGQDHGAVANALPVKIGDHKAYGLDIEPGVGYRVDNTLAVATAGEPEGMYMVASGTHVNSDCCFDFGNAEQNNLDTGAGHMDAVNLSTRCHATPCSGSGPWVQADLENGLWQANGSNLHNKGNKTSYVTAMLKNDGQENFALKGGDSTSGELSTWYDGPLPSGYAPMHQEGAVVLGTGGDDSNAGVGSWFEGVMTTRFPSVAADNAVQANIVAAKYSGRTNPSTAPTSAEATPAGQAVLHDEYSSVYTVNASNGHLQETYLPHMGGPWTTKDLYKAAHTPPVMPDTHPVALTHCGYTSVYTVDASNGDVQTTYLPKLGAKWATQDLTAKYHVPPTDQTPGAVEHTNGVPGATPGCGYTGLYTRDRNGDLQDSYLPNTGFPGDPWQTQDLSSMPSPHTPQIQPGTSPVAITHCGYTSVYTVDAANHHLQTTYLPKLGDLWGTEDLSRDYRTPSTDSTPTAVEHTAGAPGATQNCGYTSVFTVNEGSRDLEETYLPKLGGPWHPENLSIVAHTPPVAPGTHPVALVHTGYTGVYTIDMGTDLLQATYLPAIGQKWNTQNLSQEYKTPPTDQSPTALLHLDPSGNLDWTSVYTVNEFNNHLQTTYLPQLGGPWTTEDLSHDYHTPPVYVLQASQTSGSVAQSGGYTGVFTVNRPLLNDSRYGHLQWSYLPKIGANWHQDDLNINAHTPVVADGTQPVALAEPGGTTRVFTLDKINGCTCGALQVTTQPIGPNFAWSTRNLTQGSPHTAPVALTFTSAAAVFHDGYIGVYTAAAANGDLWATYLPASGDWQTQNLSAKYHIPPVKAGTSPVAVFHDGYVGVFTVDTNGDLQDSYLQVLGGPWHTLDLTKGSPHVPATSTTPTVIFRDGYVGVFTVDGLGKTADGDLQNTYLPAIGDPWSTQDLTRKYHVPEAEQGVRPTAIYHTGYTSVFFLSTVNNGAAIHLEDAFLSAIGTPWQWQDMTADYKVPRTATPSSAVEHYAADGGLTWTSLYTTNGDTQHCDLQSTYLPRIGDKWTTQDLSAKFHLGGTC